MEDLARHCKECEFYVHSQLSYQGFCDRVDDPSYAFSVQSDRRNCIYESPGRRVAIKEIKEKQDRAVRDHAKFQSSLNQASKTISGWPTWKRSLLGY